MSTLQVSPPPWNISSADVDTRWGKLWDAQSLVAVYPFPVTRTRLHDFSGKHRHLTASGVTVPAVVEWGRALLCSNADSGDYFSGPTLKNYGPEFTVIAALKYNAAAQMWWFAHDSGANDGWRLDVQGDTAGAVRLTFGGVSSYSSGVNLTINDPYLLVCRCNGNGGAFTVHALNLQTGQLTSGSVGSLGTMGGTPNQVSIGGLTWFTTEQFSGHLGPITWLDREITDSEVYDILADPFGWIRPAELLVAKAAVAAAGSPISQFNMINKASLVGPGLLGGGLIHG